MTLSCFSGPSIMEMSNEEVQVLTPLLLPPSDDNANDSGFELQQVVAKKKNPVWSEAEKCILVEEVQKRENILFGKFKGSGRCKEEKEAAWRDIAQVINSVGLHKRSTEEAKKQYSNIKQRAKDKYSEMKRPKTGGGPQPPPPTGAELAVIDGLEGRPTLRGIEAGFDTLEQSESQKENHDDKQPCIPSELQQGSRTNAQNKGSRKRPSGDGLLCKERSLIEEELKLIQRKRTKLELEIEVLQLQKLKLELEIKKMKTDVEM